jgi:DNA-binding HxlR family transcriptional regulator
MEKDSKRICLCPLEGIITTISKKWAILIISILGHHHRLRFNDLMRTLLGISPKSLTDLLKELQKEGLIQREAFSEIPPRVEYFLTEDGKQLCEAIIPLVQWAEKRDNLHQKICNSTCHSVCCPSKRTVYKSRCEGTVHMTKKK